MLSSRNETPCCYLADAHWAAHNVVGVQRDRAAHAYTTCPYRDAYSGTDRYAGAHEHGRAAFAHRDALGNGYGYDDPNRYGSAYGDAHRGACAHYCSEADATAG